MFDLEKFKHAQDFGNMYEVALREIKNGKKTSHWIWYVFPQIKGLGKSAMSQLYSIGSQQEAKAYLEDELLNNRLRECSTALLQIDCSIEEAFGNLDAKKVCSSMTLFDAVSPTDVFADVLDRHFAGRRCSMTLQFIQNETNKETDAV